MSTKQQKTATELARLVGKLSSGHEFDDWRKQIELVFASCNLGHLLESNDKVAKPTMAKATKKEIKRKLTSLRLRRDRVAFLAKENRNLRKWKKYEEFQKLSGFGFLLISSTIDTKCEAYADVRTSKDQSPSELWKRLMERYQPQRASHWGSEGHVICRVRRQ